MSKQRQSLGTAWVAVNPDGDAIRLVIEPTRVACWTQLWWQTGNSKAQLRRLGYRVVKVELMRIP